MSFSKSENQPSLWNVNNQEIQTPYLPVSVGGYEPNYQLLSPKLPFVVKIREVIFLWIKPISQHRWSSQIPGGFRMKYIWQMVLSRPPVWGLVIVYLENLTMSRLCLAIKKGKIFFCLCDLFSGLLMVRITFWWNAYSIKKCLFPLLPL